MKDIDYDMGDSTTVLLANNERSYKSRHRFKDMHTLHARYRDIKDAVDPKREKWEKFVSEWEKKDTKTKSNPPRRNTNFGQFRMKINKFIEMFSDLVLERDKWCTIRLIEVDDESKRKTFTTHITEAFQEYCIRAWPKRRSTVYLAIKDMVLFSSGVDHWPDQHCLYPKNIPVSRVYPDSHASRDPKDWELLFIEDTMTLMEIFQMVEEDDQDGWDRSSVLSMIRGNVDMFGNMADNDIMEKWINGEVDNEHMDLAIDLVFAYVKEYKSKGSSRRISHYVFPASGRYVSDNKSPPDHKESGFLRDVSEYAECMSNIVAVRGHQITRSYYQTPSEAELVYSACRLYDQVMNKVIRSVGRNANLYLSSENTKEQKKIANLRDGDEVVALSPGTTFVEQRLQHDTKGLMEAMRQVMIDTDSGSMAGLVTGSQNVKGRAITAEEARIQQAEAADGSRVYIDMFVVNEQGYLEEMYRRFTDEDLEDENIEGYKQRKLFKAKMKELGLTKKDYDLDNIILSPVFSSKAGNKSARVQGSIQMLTAVRALANATTRAEEMIIRDWIAALDSYDNVDSYMGENVDEFRATHVAKAGLENAGMSNPLENNKNFPVSGEDKHLIEIPVHLADFEYKVNTAEGLASQYANTPMNMQPFVLDDAVDITIALDNLGAHIEAHIQLSGQDETIDKNVLQQFIDVLNQLRQKEGQVENILKQLQAQASSDSENQAIQSEKLRHLMQENQEKERHTSTMDEIGKLKSLSKMQISQQGMEDKKAQTMRHKEQDYTLDTTKKVLDIRLEQEKAQQQENQQNNKPSK